jgi:hypothetical protein
MAQFARPDGDVSVGAWTTNAGGTTNLFQTIDEASAGDADFVRSELSPSSSAYECSLSDIEDPQSSAGHVVRYRYAKDAAGGQTVDLTVQLRQGTSTVIASATHTNISETVTAGSFTLSGAEADAITDYTDLRLRFIATAT